MMKQFVHWIIEELWIYFFDFTKSLWHSLSQQPFWQFGEEMDCTDRPVMEQKGLCCSYLFLHHISLSTERVDKVELAPTHDWVCSEFKFFKIFLDYMDDRTECIITVFVHDIKLGEVI